LVAYQLQPRLDGRAVGGKAVVGQQVDHRVEAGLGFLMEIGSLIE
jgi:hypothetical protein